jgi:micrococcal nuclease
MEEFRALERQAREQERGLWGPAAVPKSAQTAVGVASPSTTVYVTGTGEKYHREGCRYLARSSIPVLLESAAGRFEPCSVCRPPRM